MTEEVYRLETTTRTAAGTDYRRIKRCFDCVVSGILLVVLSPLIAGIAALVKITSRGPVFYTHTRVGMHFRLFRIYKFRTMRENADAMRASFTPEQAREWEENYKITRDPRLTKFGAFLRKTSMDELPQLVNILKGDLSLVGPRPVVEEELRKYGGSAEKFLSVLPGLTGYWQAYARNDCTYERRMETELYYVEHANPLFDLKILFKTVGRVLSRKGAW